MGLRIPIACILVEASFKLSLFSKSTNKLVCRAANLEPCALAGFYNPNEFAFHLVTITSMNPISLNQIFRIR